MPADSIDNRILGSLVTLFQAILAGATYLTSPEVLEGIPPNPVPPVDAKPRVYVSHVRTDPAQPAQSGPAHRWTSRYAVWIATKDQRATNQVRQDVMVALYAGEPTLQSLYKQPAYPLEFTRLDDGRQAGIDFAVQLLALDYQTDHTAT